MEFKPLKRITNRAINLFRVDETQINEILREVRAHLPTTEALLIGKPQAGKSSIVRGLTGVSEDIVGQGFQPHTKHTQRYAYPSEDLPLLIFTDTVGLGDISQNTDDIISELTTELDQETAKARIIILTIKINDFATDSLKKIAENLRQKYPHLPCLLVVTCLHELYSPDINNHPIYPPDLLEIKRPFDEIKKNFQGLFDEAILIDFTLEEDGYNPIFYGLEEMGQILTKLLPEAEAKAIYQLLDEKAGALLGNIYRDVARRYIVAFTMMAATVTAIPLPFATMPVLTALQVSMVGVLGQLYGQKLTPSQAGGILSALAGGFLAQSIGRELIKFIPGFGTVIAVSWASAYTWALGEGACAYFGDLVGGKKPNLDRIKEVMKTTFNTKKKENHS
ncbi:MAG: 50S ribosome-binding GTPase [Cyanobacterium sp. T60_A2020_053]|nr:50S ribosome-binding GTPase [Cyanobacterium sp. T60_A2020_053]